jgi:hypothetical protein
MKLEGPGVTGQPFGRCCFSRHRAPTPSAPR